MYERIKSSTAIDSFCYISDAAIGESIKKQKGVDVLSLTVGEPDFVTPEKNIQKSDNCFN